MTRTEANTAVLRAADAWGVADAAWAAMGSPSKAATADQSYVITRRKEAHAALLNAASALARI
jgi:hypothetical protein